MTVLVAARKTDQADSYPKMPPGPSSFTNYIRGSTFDASLSGHIFALPFPLGLGQ
jgi:hypothetical protein